ELRDGRALEIVEALLLVPLELDDDRLKRPLVPTVDRGDTASSRSCVGDAGSLAIREDRLAETHSIADLHRHRGAHADVIIAQDRDRPHGRGVLDRRLGHAAKREIEPSFDANTFYHSRYVRRLEAITKRVRRGTRRGGGRA